MSVCEEIKRDPRHNEQWFCEAMFQRLKEENSEVRNPGKNGGRPRKYATAEERIAVAKKQRKKAARLLAQANGSNETV